ncbi:MAG: hypothetical protein AAFZ15_14715 [Bacteroidota bacterium]
MSEAKSRTAGRETKNQKPKTKNQKPSPITHHSRAIAPTALFPFTEAVPIAFTTAVGAGVPFFAGQGD